MRVPPPVVAGLCLGAGMALHRLGPGPRIVPSRSARPAAALLLGAGAALIAWAVGRFRQRGTTFEPFGEPTALVASGPYRYSRNPMYLGLLLALLGCATLAGSTAAFAGPAAFFAAMNATQIPREERTLAVAFGQAYRDYRRQVRRWL